MAQNDWEKFLTQRQNAFKRGIEWKLSFEDWISWWQQTGHYSDRGRGLGKYVMSRIGDSGAYELTNIICHKHGDNVSDAQKNKPKSVIHRHNMSLNAGKYSACKVKTPDGEFESAYAAGRHYKITGEAVMWRCKQTTGQYKDWIRC
jgi:hypothetical protein